MLRPRRAAAVRPASRTARRDAPKLEARRLSALRHIQAGEPWSVIARRFGVSRQAVHQWAKQYRRLGAAGLRRKARPGRPPKLTRQQIAQLPSLLARGAKANGFATPDWTAPRVAEWIWKRFRVRYSREYVCRMLRRFGWTWQKLGRRGSSKSSLRRWVPPNPTPSNADPSL
jgi:transposase